MQRHKSYDHYDTSHKLLMVGDSECGKTSLVNWLMTEDFCEAYETTKEISFKIKTIATYDEKRIIKLLIWDLPSQKEFYTLEKDNHYQNSVGCMVVFSLTNANSFYNVENWLTEITTNDPTETQILIVGNKCEDKDDRAITYEEAVRFAESHGCKYIETSCKSGYNIENAFRQVACDMQKMHEQQFKDELGNNQIAEEMQIEQEEGIIASIKQRGSNLLDSIGLQLRRLSCI